MKKATLNLSVRQLGQLVAVALLAQFATPTYANCSFDPDCPLVWADEFDGDQLDLSKWTYMIGNGQLFGLPGWGNNELQYYTNVNDTVANGVLRIEGRNESLGGYNYTSTRIRSLGKGDWTYGRFEMRAKLPVGQGAWPAFWMLPSDSSIYGTWAASGEIDIVESTGDNPDRVFGTLHYGGPFPQNTFNGNSTFLPAGEGGTEFHEYAVEWQNGEIRWYIDDQLYAIQNAWFSTAASFPAPFDVDFHLLLNLAIGGNLPGNPDGTTQFPLVYEIDYVRVYELPPEVPTPPGILFDDLEHGAPFDNGWYSFSGDVGGGGINADTVDLPPAVSGDYSLASGWGTGGATGFAGGFGRTFPTDLSGMSRFTFWINPDANQTYRLEFNFQDDDNGDNSIAFPPDGQDDEFQFNCDISPTGPCAIAGGGWQQVTVPFESLFDDNSFHFGGNGTFDPVSVVNGPLVNVVVTINATSGSNITFRTDEWRFSAAPDSDDDGVLDSVDNCSQLSNPDQTDADNDGFGNACDPDLNNDGVVNFLDLGVFSDLFLSSDPVADFNVDGSVNFLDLILIQETFLGAPGPGATGN